MVVFPLTLVRVQLLSAIMALGHLVTALVVTCYTAAPFSDFVLIVEQLPLCSFAAWLA